MAPGVGSNIGSFKESLFAFEADDLPESMRIVCDAIEKRFVVFPECATTFVQMAGTVKGAAKMIDQFREKACGSAYSLALINLSQFPSMAELEFLLDRRVLGDPRTIFLCSLRGISKEAYRFAKEKVDREAQLVREGKAFGTPSCIENYSPANKPDKVQLVGDALAAYLREADARARHKQAGGPPGKDAFEALKVINRSDTAYVGLKRGSVTALLGRI